MGSRKRRRIKMAKIEDNRQFRSSMASILTAFETYGELMTDQHLDVMKKTPFYLLFNALLEGNVSAMDCHRGEALTADIMYVFDSNKRKFKLGGLKVGLTRNDVRLVFGIIDGTRAINLYKGTKTSWNFYQRTFAGDIYLNPKVVKDKLQAVFSRKPQSKIDVEDTVRLLCLLLFTTLFVPLKGFSLTWGWVEYVEDLDRMREYDWSGVIVSLLLNSLVEKHMEPYQVVGCTMLLPYWLCEHASVISARDRVDALPRFVRWHLAGLKKVVSRQKLMMLAKDEVIVGELVSTDVESAMYASLKDYVGVGGTTSTEESDSLDKLYSDMVADHDELQLKYNLIQEDNKNLKEKLCELAEGSKSIDFLVAKYEEKLMILNGQLITSIGEKAELSEKYVILTQERDALRKRVKSLDKQLAEQKDINMVQSEKINELNNRWVEELIESEVHAVTQAAVEGKSNEAQTAHDLTQDSPGEVGKSNVEQMQKQNSMIRRLKGKTRKTLLVDDDFEYGTDVKKMKLGGCFPGDKPMYFKTNADLLAVLDRDHAGHCAKFMESQYLTTLREKMNKGWRETVYFNKYRMTLVDVRCILDIFRGEYISNWVVEAYGQYLVKTLDPVKHASPVTIIEADCWRKVMKQDSKDVMNEVMTAALKNAGMILLPILSTGSRNEVGYGHWTLLVMDVDEQEWRFYNSKRTRTGKTADKYLEDAKLLKKKLEIAMAEKSSSELGYDLLESDIHLRLVEMPAPQQGATCDCAIFVCYFLRHLVRNEELKTKLGKDVIKKFKAEVIESIMKC